MKTGRHVVSYSQLLKRVQHPDVWHEHSGRFPAWLPGALGSVVAATDGEEPRVVSGKIDDGVIPQDSRARLVVLTDSFYATLTSPWTDDASPHDFAVTVRPLSQLTRLQLGTWDQIANGDDEEGWPSAMFLTMHFGDGEHLELPLRDGALQTTRYELAKFLPSIVAALRASS